MEIFIVTIEDYDFKEEKFARRNSVFSNYEGALAYYNKAIESCKDELFYLCKNWVKGISTSESSYTKDFETEEKQCTIKLLFDLKKEVQLDSYVDFITPEVNYIWSFNPLKKIIKDELKENSSIVEFKIAEIKLEAIKVLD